MKDLIILDNGDIVATTIGNCYYISQSGTLYTTYNEWVQTPPDAMDINGNEYRVKKARPHKRYLAVSVMRGGVRARVSIHSLVAKAFCPKSKHHTQVNHKDCNKLNNHYTNLEWCTGDENIAHAKANGRIGISDGTKRIGKFKHALTLAHKIRDMRPREAMIEYGLTYNQVVYLKVRESRGYKRAGGGYILPA